MRAAWLLSINAWSGRKGRTALLVAAVALSATLVAAVACAMASLNTGVEYRMAQRIGAADLRVRHVFNEHFDRHIADKLTANPRVEAVTVRVRGAINVKAAGESTATQFRAVLPENEELFRPEIVKDGQPIAQDGEILFDEKTAEKFGIEVGDTITLLDYKGAEHDFILVAVTENLTLEFLDTPQGAMTLNDLERMTGMAGRAKELQVILQDEVDVAAFAEDFSEGLEGDLIAEPTTRVTAGYDAMMQGNTVMFLLASVFAFISASFIVLTGMTVNSAERQRELAILRCIGGNRFQLAMSQIVAGSTLGAAGAIFGIPAGILLAWVLTIVAPDRLPAGLHLWPMGLALAFIGSVVAGVLGSGYSAYNASRAKPVPAMRSQASSMSVRSVAVVSAAAVALIAVQIVIVGFSQDPDTLIKWYTPLGMPSMFVGYFLLGVPVSVAVAWVASGVISRLFGLPPNALRRSFAGTPFRNGFTAGALMVGLALMTSVWTNGSSLIRDWIDTIKFPDAFANSVLSPLTPEMRARVDNLPEVESTTAITLFKTKTQAFGVELFGNKPGTSFIAFEPDEFFEMTELKWAAGDPEKAIPKLEAGGAILVAKEFLVYREGYGIGDMFPIEYRGRTLEFEIVGAVSSPGLDIVNRYFDIGEEYAEQSVHAVFGTRADLRKHFGTDRIDLLQISLAPSLAELSDAQATKAIRGAINSPGVVVGS
ncbi:MAG: ABC transporter permease, partial [Planctomycetota bacterium]